MYYSLYLKKKIDEDICMKKKLENELLIYPCPVVLVTSEYENLKNVLAVSWTGIASSHPEYVTISIKPNRFSHHLILESKEFTINIPNDNLLKKVDYCGTVSGRDTNKFIDCSLNCAEGKNVCSPMIIDCPVNIECSVHQAIELGSHTLIIGKVLGKFINDNISTSELHEALNPTVYFRPNYYGINKTVLGSYGQMNNE